MTFATTETSLQDGHWVDCYEIDYASTAYDLTSLNEEFTLGGVTYTPAAISHTQPKAATEAEAAAIEVTLPVTHAIVQQYFTVAPVRPGTVRILKTHYSEIGGTEETIEVFRGRIVSMKVGNGLEATLQCRPDTQAFKRQGPRIQYTTVCSHVWGDGRCGVSRAAFSYDGTVASTSNQGLVVEVSGAAAAKGASPWFRGGYIEYPAGGNEELRLIISQSGDDMRIIAPFANSIVGTTVRVYAGCAHTLTECATKFSNAANFGGFPYTPIVDPHQQSKIGA